MIRIITQQRLAELMRVSVYHREKAVEAWAEMPNESDAHSLLLDIRQARRDIEAALRAKSAPIVCLCGSTRFKNEFIRLNLEFTLRGYIVLTVGCFVHADGDTYAPTPEEKLRLDELHKRKIDLADVVHVINVGGYIGDSTQKEIEYARSLGKPVTFLEEPANGS